MDARLKVKEATVRDLRKTLADLGESSKGTKAELAARLKARCPADPPGPAPGGGPPEADVGGEPDKAAMEAERRRRLTLETLNGVLARKQCPHCATVGAWRIYNVERTRGRVRYVRCLACGKCDQAPVIPEEIDDDEGEGEGHAGDDQRDAAPAGDDAGEAARG